jgi:putative DNA primase/helicase
VGEKLGLGIGFVLTPNDPYTCIDLDKVIANRCLEPRAQLLLDLVHGYVELSPSGTGLHIWVKCREVINRRTKGIEIYSSQRWMTITGRANPSAPKVIPDQTDEVAQLIEQYFPAEETTVFHAPQETTVDDHELWERLFRSKHGDFVQALYRGDLSVVSNDHSRGVIMLANLLAVFTDGDEARMKQMFLQTGLVNDKWFEKRGAVTWIEYQIRDAVVYVTNGK